jgi:hypothetical protein
MLTIKKLSLLGVAAAAVGLLSVPVAQAETFSDTGAAVLVWPKIVVDVSTDTVIQLTNQNVLQPSAAHCFYVNANSRCTNTGEACLSSSACFDGMTTGTCKPGWIEINFDVFLTRDQPVAWSAANGFGNGDLPCPGGLGSIAPETPARGFPRSARRLHRRVEVHPVNPITRLPFACNDAAG